MNSNGGDRNICSTETVLFPSRRGLGRCRRLIGRKQLDAGSRVPRHLPLVHDQRSRQQFYFMSEQIERHHSGQLGQVFIDHSAERNRSLRLVENHRLREVCRGVCFPHKDQRGKKLKPLLGDIDSRNLIARREGHAPWPLGVAAAFNAIEHGKIKGEDDRARDQKRLGWETRLHYASVTRGEQWRRRHAAVNGKALTAIAKLAINPRKALQS